MACVQDAAALQMQPQKRHGNFLTSGTLSFTCTSGMALRSASRGRAAELRHDPARAKTPVEIASCSSHRPLATMIAGVRG